MKLVLVGTAVVLLVSAVELARPVRRKRSTNELTQSYRNANVTPVPQSALDVRDSVYFGDIEVTVGIELTPAEATPPPTIEFDFEPGSYYTLIEISPDWPSAKYPYLGASLLGLIVNIRGNSKGVKDSYKVMPWFPPLPPPYTGLHRYLIYLYKQNRMIDTKDKALLGLRCNSVRFSLSNFVKTYNLISPPIAGTIYYSQFDSQYC